MVKRDNEMKWRREGIYRGLEFGKVMQINKREGAICKVGGEVFLLANGGLPK